MTKDALTQDIPSTAHLADLYARAQKRGNVEIATTIAKAAETAAEARSLSEKARQLAAFVEPV